MEAQIADMEADSERTLAEVQEAVGALSDLLQALAGFVGPVCRRFGGQVGHRLLE